jgi:hypothetical protein
VSLPHPQRLKIMSVEVRFGTVDYHSISNFHTATTIIPRPPQLSNSSSTAMDSKEFKRTVEKTIGLQDVLRQACLPSRPQDETQKPNRPYLRAPYNSSHEQPMAGVTTCWRTRLRLLLPLRPRYRYCMLVVVAVMMAGNSIYQSALPSWTTGGYDPPPAPFLATNQRFDAHNGAQKPLISVDKKRTFTRTSSQQQNPNIAIVSGFVSKNPDDQVRPPYFGHLINKACYANRHNYTFIFNTTWGYPNERPRNTTRHARNRHLDSGTWAKVPYLQSALDQGYDWVFWNDVDYMFQNLSKPLDEFIQAWDYHGLDVQVFLPNDRAPRYSFNSWAILIKNSPFGRRLLHNWDEFGQGLCPVANFRQTKYTWRISDQPGLWYALVKTHAELVSNRTFSMTCSNGFLAVKDKNWPVEAELDEYFRYSVFHNLTTPPSNLSEFPKDQPILWSDAKNGLGVNVEAHVGFRRTTIADNKLPTFPESFGLHIKERLPFNVLHDIDQCRHLYGCAASYDTNSTKRFGPPKLDVRCGDQSNRAV